jgi:hypothetical protein
MIFTALFVGGDMNPIRTAALRGFQTCTTILTS